MNKIYTSLLIIFLGLLFIKSTLESESASKESNNQNTISLSKDSINSIVKKIDFFRFNCGKSEIQNILNVNTNDVSFPGVGNYNEQITFFVDYHDNKIKVKKKTENAARRSLFEWVMYNYNSEGEEYKKCNCIPGEEKGNLIFYYKDENLGYSARVYYHRNKIIKVIEGEGDGELEYYPPFKDSFIKRYLKPKVPSYSLGEGN